jgi:hemolysin activation/secretion protein
VLIHVALLGVALPLAAPTWAQSVPDPTLEQQRIQQREDAERRRLEPNPEVRLEAPAAPQPGHLPDSESPCFPIHAVRWAYAQADAAVAAWEPWLDTALAGPKGDDGPIGRCIGAAGVRILQERAQNALLRRGYTTSRVLVEAQDLSGGELRLTILPGRIHAIRLAEPENPRAMLWNALPLKAGDILNLRDLEQGLENLKRVPSADADIKIEPAEAGPGETPLGPAESDVVVTYTQGMPLRLAAGVDDSGTQATGKYQGSVTVFYDNALTLNDAFYFSLNHDLGGSGGHGTHGHTAHHEIPWGYWLLGLTASQYNYHQTIAGATTPIIYSGEGASNEIALSRVLQRDARGKTTLGLKGWQRTANNAINGTEVGVQRRVEGGWEFALERSQAIGSASLTSRIAYKKGTGAFGALHAPEELFGEGTSRFGLWKTDLALSAPFKLGGQLLRYSGTWRGQFNTTRLTPLDQFAIGGRYTVRGFDGERQLAAERGWVWRNDLGWFVGNTGQELYAGIDYGQVGGPSAADLVGRHLAGAVVGLRGRFSGVQYDLFVGRPVSKPQYFTTARWSAGFSLNWTF